MEIIPVLDLKDGLVVRGVKGERSAYRPIETPLSSSAEPLAVLEGLMRLHAFQTVYLADLDAIMGGKPAIATYRALADAFPGVGFWIDAGFRDRADLGTLKGLDAARPVVGSETLSEVDLLRSEAFRTNGILSLDFKGDAFLGEPSILDSPASWPDRLIVMTLARVGSGEGPDLDRLGEISARAGKRRAIHAAGGLRDAEDLQALAAIGVAGVLTASALHDGRLTRDDILRAMG